MTTSELEEDLFGQEDEDSSLGQDTDNECDYWKIARRDQEIVRLRAIIARRNQQIVRRNAKIARRNHKIVRRDAKITGHDATVRRRNDTIASMVSENARLREHIQIS